MAECFGDKDFLEEDADLGFDFVMPPDFFFCLKKPFISDFDVAILSGLALKLQPFQGLQT